MATFLRSYAHNYKVASEDPDERIASKERSIAMNIESEEQFDSRPMQKGGINQFSAFLTSGCDSLDNALRKDSESKDSYYYNIHLAKKGSAHIAFTTPKGEKVVMLLPFFTFLVLSQTRIPKGIEEQAEADFQNYVIEIVEIPYQNLFYKEV